jgi:DNA-binding transcriptional MerR regulator
MFSTETTYSLEELSAEVARLLGVLGLIGAAYPDLRVSTAPDARTVRYYGTLGLLDRPRIESRQARYGKRHVLQLLSIKALQAMDMPLAEIQQRLYARSDSELEMLLGSLKVEQTEPQPPALKLRELVVEPGLRLVVEEGWTPRDPAALEEKLRAAVAALSRTGGNT